MYVTTFIIKAKKGSISTTIAANTYNKCERSQNHATNERVFQIEYLGGPNGIVVGKREREREREREIYLFIS